MLQQAIRAARLDRRLYAELFFDSYATGNAVMLVAGIGALNHLGAVLLGPARFSVIGLVYAVISALFGWLIVALALWLVGTKIFEGAAQIPTVVRLTGFAHVPLVLLAFVALSELFLLAALVWFVAALSVAAQVLFDLDRFQAIASALLAVAIWWVVSILLF